MASQKNLAIGIPINPYNYGTTARRKNLIQAELTGCSMTPDNCHGADGHEFAKAPGTFRMPSTNIPPVFGNLRTAERRHGL
jgi:hypothetical protein